jgi:hypothetical protein
VNGLDNELAHGRLTEIKRPAVCFV